MSLEVPISASQWVNFRFNDLFIDENVFFAMYFFPKKQQKEIYSILFNLSIRNIFKAEGLRLIKLWLPTKNLMEVGRIALDIKISRNIFTADG